MNTKGIKKLMVTVIALGLSLNGLCMNLIAPKTAMAQAMGTPAATMHESDEGMHKSADAMHHSASAMQEKEDRYMLTTESIGDCGNMDMNSNLNCCLVPMSHGNDKSQEVKTPGETRQHVNIAAVKVESTDIFKIGESTRLRRFHHLGGPAPASNITGQIVKRE